MSEDNNIVISKEAIAKLKRKAKISLPPANNVTDWTPNMIRSAIYGALFDGDDSIIGVINGGLSEANKQINKNNETIREYDQTIAEMKDNISNLQSEEKTEYDVVIEYKNSNGTTVKSATKRKNKAIVTLFIPSSPSGYKFECWNYKNGETLTKIDSEITSIEVTSNIYIVATYIELEVECKITIMNDDRVVTVDSVNKGDNYTLKSFVKTGYTQGAYTLNYSKSNTSESKNANDTIQVNEDITANLSYTPNQYTITYKDGDETKGSQVVTYDSTFSISSSITSPSKVGYEFIGWYYNNTTNISSLSPYNIASDIEVVAKYQEANCNVTIMDGSIQHSIELVGKGSNYTFKEVSKTGYTQDDYKIANSDGTFSYYSPKSSITIENDITAYLQYTPNQYTISFKVDDNVVHTQSVTYDSSFTLETPQDVVTEKVGYTFDGWYYGSKKANDLSPYKIANDIYIEPRYTPITYSITYTNTNGTGSVSTDTPKTYTIESKDIDLSNITLSDENGKGFKYWVDTNGNKVDKIPSGSTGNIVLTSYWESYIYYITFELDGGYFNVDGQTITEDKIVNVNKGTNITYIYPVPLKKDYTFIKWYRLVNGNKVYWYANNSAIKTEYDLTENVVLKPEYEENLYKVTFKLNGGSVNGSTENIEIYVSRNGSITYPTVTKTGYKFIQWNDSNGNAYTDDKIPSDSTELTLNAIYHKEYTITYKIVMNDVDQYGVDKSIDSTLHTQKVYEQEEYDIASEIESKLTTWFSTTSHQYYIDRYEFDYWAYEVNEVMYRFIFGGTYDFNSDITLYGVLKPLEFDINYHDNGVVTKGKYTYGIGIPSPLNPLQSTSTNRFLGWYETPSSTTKIDSIGIYECGEKTFYSKWDAIYYSSTLTKNTDYGDCGFVQLSINDDKYNMLINSYESSEPYVSFDDGIDAEFTESASAQIIAPNYDDLDGKTFQYAEGNYSQYSFTYNEPTTYYNSNGNDTYQTNLLYKKTCWFTTQAMEKITKYNKQPEIVVIIGVNRYDATIYATNDGYVMLLNGIYYDFVLDESDGRYKLISDDEIEIESVTYYFQVEN